MNSNHRRLGVWMIAIALAAIVGFGGFSQSEATQIESIDPQRQVLQNLLVGVSGAIFYFHPDVAGGPHSSIFGTSLDSGWLAIADLAIGGFAYLQSTTDASQLALVSNLQDALVRVGNLAADILGLLPLVIEVYAEDISVEQGEPIIEEATVGWITLDAEALRTGLVPIIVKANESMKALLAVADDLAIQIGMALDADESNSESWRRRYLPGVGVYVNVTTDPRTGLLPRNLNTVDEWESTLIQLLGGCDETLSAMAADERVIIAVDNLVGGGTTFFLIGRDDLLAPSAWEIVYWK